jgi:hypothetical protein
VKGWVHTRCGECPPIGEECPFCDGGGVCTGYYDPREIGSVPRTGSLSSAIGDAIDALEMTAPPDLGCSAWTLRDDGRPGEQWAALRAIARVAVERARHADTTARRLHYRTVAAIVGRVMWLVREEASRAPAMSLEAQLRASVALTAGRAA